MDELARLAKSFGYAFRGIWYAVRTQRNMRIHLVALAVVVLFGLMEGLSAVHWCLELLCCMLVISLELVNTALESACDALSPERNETIGHAKDAAAGAVLAAAMGSVVVACLIFFRGGPYRTGLLEVLRRHTWIKYLLAAGGGAGLLFIFLPGAPAKRKKK